MTNLDVIAALHDDGRSSVRYRSVLVFVVPCLFIFPTRKRLPFNRFPNRFTGSVRALERCTRARVDLSIKPIRVVILLLPPRAYPNTRRGR